jgi:hypothetical protein
LCSSSQDRTCSRYRACSGVSFRSTRCLLRLTGQSVGSGDHTAAVRPMLNAVHLR